MGNEIKATAFFEAIKEEIEKDNNINKKIRELIKTKDFNLKKYFENCENVDDIIPILQKINEYFLRNYEIHIDENLIIRPIETEIYFANTNGCYDGMCHMNELQKGFIKDENGKAEERFGKLYFHRYKNSTTSNLCRGGVDVCISNSEKYYLSILIRGAYINNQLFCGINKIMKKILEYQKDYKSIERDDVLFEREDRYKNQKYFIYQNRIISGKYSIDGMPLNIIINDEKIFNEIDNKNETIVSSVRTHYRYIKDTEGFKYNKNILISLSLEEIK